MIAKRPGWASVRGDMPQPRPATQSRPAPAATNSAPKTTPTASGPPPAISARTIITKPSTSMASERIWVARRCTKPMLGPAAQARQGAARGRRRRAVATGAVGVYDHAARALGEDRLDRLAEDRAAGARRQRHDHGLRAHLARLVDDHPARLAGADLLVVAAHAAPALEAGLLDDRLGRELLLGHLGGDRRRRRHRDRDQDVDAPPPPGRHLDGGGHRA